MLHSTLLTPPRPHNPRSASLKRKRDLVELESDLPDGHEQLPVPSRSTGPPRKRPNTLEMGFASLSLDQQPLVEACDDAQWLSGPAVPQSTAQSRPEVISCPVIEMAEDPLEPQPSSSVDVDMKKSTWYERDKDHIVILDLDSDDEDSSRSGSPAPGEYAISKTLLSLLPMPSTGVSSLPPESAQLVLYRPSPWAGVESDDRPARSRNIDRQDVLPTYIPAADAMDIEESE